MSVTGIGHNYVGCEVRYRYVPFLVVSFFTLGSKDEESSHTYLR